MMAAMACAAVLLLACVTLVPCWCCYVRARHAAVRVKTDLEEDAQSEASFGCQTSRPTLPSPAKHARKAFAYPSTPVDGPGIAGVMWVGAVAPAPVRQTLVNPPHLRLQAPAIIYEFNTLSGVRYYI